MNEYEQQQEERRTRLAQAAQAEAAQAAQTSRLPGMRGHNATMRHLERAADLQRRAAAVGRGGVSSDDPDAVAKLTDQLGHLHAWQEHMVAANKLVRKNDQTGLHDLGLDEAQIHALFNPQHRTRKGYPSYQLHNNSANIRRIEQRIADIARNQATAATFTPLSGDGWDITVDDNRVIIAFAEHTTREQYQQLRSHGFIWAPTRNAYVRKLSPDALYWAKQLVGATEELPPIPTSDASDAPA